MLQWFIDNKEWVFSGLGVAIIGTIIGFFKKNPELLVPTMSNTVTVNTTVSTPRANTESEVSCVKSLESRKSDTRILFIDDDSKFKVVQILKNSGWSHTKTIKDAKSLDCPEIAEADILFVDIQGVGKQLYFSDEGLGLANAIKEKYPHKGVVIYSAETKGDRFHKALLNVDSFLPKNADPYEFQQLVEELSIGK